MSGKLNEQEADRLEAALERIARSAAERRADLASVRTAPGAGVDALADEIDARARVQELAALLDVLIAEVREALGHHS